MLVVAVENAVVVSVGQAYGVEMVEVVRQEFAEGVGEVVVRMGMVVTL